MVEYFKVLPLLMAVGLGLSALGCTLDHPDPNHCPPRPHPTFRLTVNAADGPVPLDVRIQVKFGAGEESWALSKPGQSPEEDPKAVLCTALSETDGGTSDANDASSDGAADAGDTSSDATTSAWSPDRPITRVVCELWTNGAASVHVTASGYPEEERDLAADQDECGIVQTDELITLERPDAE